MGETYFEWSGGERPVSPRTRVDVVLGDGTEFNGYAGDLKWDWCMGGHGGDIVRFRKADGDPVEHPKHYTSHPSGIECIQITEHMGFNLGNAMKYIWRADLKHDDATEDLRKAKWYIEREIAKRSK